MSIYLLQNATQNGDGSLYESVGIDPARRNGMTLYVLGNFNGATVTLYASPDTVNWVSVQAVTQTGIIPLNISAAALKATISNAGSSTNINVIAL